MEVIPAVDLRGGRCVRLVQGDYGRETIFGDPVAFARRWVAEGARRLHVVDLDGAREGRPNPLNLSAVEAIVQSVRVPVQLGGGIRAIETAEAVLNMGVERVVIGTSLAVDEAAARSFCEVLGPRMIAGIDARDGLVAVEGWQRATRMSAVEFAARMVALGVPRIVFTDIACDGTQAGPNVESLKKVAGAVGDVPVIASGGIGTISDVERLVAEAPANVEGVIVGRSLYSGSLDLAAAIAAASRRPPGPCGE